MRFLINNHQESGFKWIKAYITILFCYLHHFTLMLSLKEGDNTYVIEITTTICCVYCQTHVWHAVPSFLEFGMYICVCLLVSSFSKHYLTDWPNYAICLQFVNYLVLSVSDFFVFFCSSWVSNCGTILCFQEYNFKICLVGGPNLYRFSFFFFFKLVSDGDTLLSVTLLKQ